MQRRGTYIGATMKGSKKPVILKLWEIARRRADWTVYLNDVSKAIRQANADDNAGRSEGNPANFFKDIVRTNNASRNWPKELTEEGITGRQVFSEGRVFQFQRFREGQTEAFPERYPPPPVDDAVRIQSISIPQASKALGRRDESWLIQVAVHLNLIEHHFASASNLPVVEIFHMQNNIKLNRTEIDALFRATLEKSDGDGNRKNALITCEAKNPQERILDHQILNQIAAAQPNINRKDIEADLIIPIAIRSVNPDGCIQVIEFEHWEQQDARQAVNSEQELQISNNVLYKLQPPVEGIGYRRHSD